MGKDTEREIRNKISKILVKWSMPTRQVAINEITTLLSSQRKEWEEKIKSAWNYPCDCDRKQRGCVHNKEIYISLATKHFDTPQIRQEAAEKFEKHNPIKK